jgi:hypothetical protein
MTALVHYRDENIIKCITCQRVAVIAEYIVIQLDDLATVTLPLTGYRLAGTTY